MTKPENARDREPAQRVSPLPPRAQRPLGHQSLRRGSEKLYSRYGSFRVKGMWGSFAFDVVFRTLVGVTLGLVVGLAMLPEEQPALEGRQVLVLQLVPSLHVLAVYLWQSRREVMRERKYITRIGLLFGFLYGRFLPPLVLWLTSL